MIEQPDLTRRATRAYYRICKRRLWIPQCPAGGSSGPERIGGKDYVVLRNCHGPLAVYRYQGDRLRHVELIADWPKRLRDEREQGPLAGLRRRGRRYSSPGPSPTP